MWETLLTHTEVVPKPSTECVITFLRSSQSQKVSVSGIVMLVKAGNLQMELNKEKDVSMNCYYSLNFLFSSTIVRKPWIKSILAAKRFL